MRHVRGTAWAVGCALALSLAGCSSSRPTACAGTRLTRQAAVADIRQGIRGHKVFSIEAKLVHWTEWTSAANNLPAGAVTSLPPAVANDPLVWVALVHGELPGVNGPSPVTWEAVALDANTGTDQGAYTQAGNPNEPPFFMKLSDLSHGGC